MPPVASRLPPTSGFALVATLLMVAAITGAAVAFFQSTRIERQVTRNYADITRARFAAEAGLAAGQALLVHAITNGRVGTNQWNYISGHGSAFSAVTATASNAEGNSFAFIAQTDPSSGTVLPNRTTYLVSTSAAASNTWIALGNPAVDPRYPAHWTNLVVSNALGISNTNARYAFWISDDTTKLNYRVMGTNAVRGFGTDPSGVALLVRETATSATSTRLPTNLLRTFSTNLIQTTRVGTNTVTNRGWNNTILRRLESALMTPGSIKTFMEANNLTPVPTQSLENDLARETLSAPVAPNGRPKLNLTRLAAYLNSLPLDQGSEFSRAGAVNDVLNGNNTENWGGGDLSFLTNSAVMGTKYTASEARQFIANLFDAIDSDKIPTTDWSETSPGTDPTFLGTEFWMDTGKPQGHPFIVYLAGGYYVGVNSCRSHLAIGFANPWPEPTESWADRYILGESDGGDRFLKITTFPDSFPQELKEDGQGVGNYSLKGMPVALRDANTQGIRSNSGGLFPCTRNPVPGQGNEGLGPHYSISKSGVSIPAGGTLEYSVDLINLYYSSGAGDYLVARVPSGLRWRVADSIRVNTNEIAYAANRKAVWLTNDPRLGALRSSYWNTNQNNGASGSGLGTIPTSQGGGALGGGGGAALRIMPATETDGAQGINPDIVASSSSQIWFRDTDITNHFNMDGSIVVVTNAGVVSNRIRGLGFLGYLSVGKPWRTLSLTASNNPTGEEDWKILDYVYAGNEIYTSNEISHVTTMASGTYATNGARGSWPGNFSRDGSINVHTVNRNTWRALFQGIPSFTNNPGSITSLANAMSTPPSNRIYAHTLAFMTNDPVAAIWTGTSANKFAREEAARYAADLLTTRSRSFTIYAMGEVLATNSPVPRPIARSLMLSRVRLGVNTNADTDTNAGGVTLEVLEIRSY